MILVNIVDKIKKAIRTPMLKAGLISLLALTMLFSLPKKADSDIVIKTVMPGATNWVRDGTTEYQMDVYADSTADDVKTNKIRYAEWDVIVPNFLNVTRTELPDPDNNPSTNVNDFFYDFYMNPSWNDVDDTISGGRLHDNYRNVNSNNGPTNRTGILGSYWFTVNTDAPLGGTSFFLSAVEFGDTDYVTYKLSSHNLTIENQGFNVVPVPEPTTAGLVISGLLALSGAHGLFKRKR